MPSGFIRRTLAGLLLGVLVAEPSLATAAFVSVDANERDCWAAFDVAGTASTARVVACHDGDPNCDADGTADGVCNFSVRVCVAVRHVPGCIPRRIDRISVRAQRRVYPPPSIPLPALPTARQTCGDVGSVPVFLHLRNGRSRLKSVTLRLKATTAQDLHERDVLKLVCLPEAIPCPANEMGGPSSVVFTAAGRSDVDLGSSGLLHNVSVAGGRIPICLSECDGDADPRCRASGVPGGLFDAPVPILADGMPLCLVVRMTNVAGEADVGTGAIDLQAAIADDVYVTDATKLCPSCAGVCDSGARAGLSCIADRVSTIGGVRYPLSRSCLPDGDPVVSLAFTVPLTTGTSTFPAACLPTIDATCGDCVEKGVCTGDACVDHDESGTCIDAKGGLSQACCARNITRPCFPPDLARTGSAVAPQPATNDVGYPRTASGATLAGGFCVPPSGIPALDDAIGLPGPGALILPVREDWNR